MIIQKSIRQFAPKNLPLPKSHSTAKEAVAAEKGPRQGLRALQQKVPTKPEGPAGNRDSHQVRRIRDNRRAEEDDTVRSLARLVDSPGKVAEGSRREEAGRSRRSSPVSWEGNPAGDSRAVVGRMGERRSGRRVREDSHRSCQSEGSLLEAVRPVEEGLVDREDLLVDLQGNQVLLDVAVLGVQEELLQL